MQGSVRLRMRPTSGAAGDLREERLQTQSSGGILLPFGSCRRRPLLYPLLSDSQGPRPSAWTPEPPTLATAKGLWRSAAYMTL